MQKMHTGNNTSKHQDWAITEIYSHLETSASTNKQKFISQETFRHPSLSLSLSRFVLHTTAEVKVRAEGEVDVRRFECIGCEWACDRTLAATVFGQLGRELWKLLI